MASLRSLNYVLDYFMCLSAHLELARELPDFGADSAIPGSIL